MEQFSEHYPKYLDYLAYILKKYKLSREAYESLLHAQNGCCAICKKRERLVIDHDHKTKKVRGLLCYYCNGILGKIAKHPEILQNIPDYLNRTKNKKRLGIAKKSIAA